MNKEQVYDDQISPLMLQIIDICKAKGIAMIASFDIAHDGTGPNGEDCSSLTCTSLLPDENNEPNPAFARACAMIRRGNPSPSMTLTTVHGDGSQTMTAFI